MQSRWLRICSALDTSRFWNFVGDISPSLSPSIFLSRFRRPRILSRYLEEQWPLFSCCLILALFPTFFGIPPFSVVSLRFLSFALSTIPSHLSFSLPFFFFLPFVSSYPRSFSARPFSVSLSPSGGLVWKPFHHSHCPTHIMFRASTFTFHEYHRNRKYPARRVIEVGHK